MLLWPVYLAHRVAGSWLQLVALPLVLPSWLLSVLPRLVLVRHLLLLPVLVVPLAARQAVQQAVLPLVQARPQLAPVQQVAQVVVLVLKLLEAQAQSSPLVEPRPLQKAQALSVRQLLVLVNQPVLVNLVPMKPLQQAAHQG